MKSYEDIIAEAQALVDEHADPDGKLPDGIVMRVVASLDEDDKGAIGAAFGIVAGFAMLSNGTFCIYNKALGIYASVTISEEPPLDNGVFVNFDNEEDGFVVDGVVVDHEGVTGKACVICGEESCTDPATCRDRKSILAAVRGMGKAVPREGLRNVDDVT